MQAYRDGHAEAAGPGPPADPAPARGAAAAGRGSLGQGDGRHPQHLSQDCGVPQVPHDGGPGDPDHSGAGAVRRETRTGLGIEPVRLRQARGAVTLGS